MEGTGILPKAAPDLRAFSPDSILFLVVLETAESFCASLGERGYPSTTPLLRGSLTLSRACHPHSSWSSATACSYSPTLLPLGMGCQQAPTLACLKLSHHCTHAKGGALGEAIGILLLGGELALLQVLAALCSL